LDRHIADIETMRKEVKARENDRKALDPDNHDAWLAMWLE
jgi:hypothetical protein